MPDIFVAKANNLNTAQTVLKSAPKAPPVNTVKLNVDDNSQKSSGSVHLFTSYCENPEDITFENQEEDEKVLLFIRKDVITNLPWMLTGTFLFIVPMVLISLLSLLHIPYLILPSSYTMILTVFYYLFVTTFLFISFITWYFNIDLVTQKRIIDIDFEGIVYKNVAATKITLVQDVSYSQVGVIRTLFDFGNVLVQTAGTIDNFTFEAVPKPDDAVHVIENLIGKRNEQL